MTTTQDGKIHEPWWIAWVLGLLLALSWADRGLPGILLGSIKKSLLVTDAQLGLLSGTAFGICYAIAGIPVAWLADRSSRSRLISVGVVIWSLLTAFSAMAANFGTLFVARMGVGIGEAVLLPCAYSLIADTFSRNARARAASILVLGTPIGAGIALWCGAVLLDYFSRTNVLPALHLEPWRMVFLTMGAVGILVGVIPMMLKEPRRTVEIADRVRHSPGSTSIPGDPLATYRTHCRRHNAIQHVRWRIHCVAGAAIRSSLPHAGRFSREISRSRCRDPGCRRNCSGWGFSRETYRQIWLARTGAAGASLYNLPWDSDHRPRTMHQLTRRSCVHCRLLVVLIRGYPRCSLGGDVRGAL